MSDYLRPTNPLDPADVMRRMAQEGQPTGSGSAQQKRVTKYILEIYEPNSVHDLWVVFESLTPFLAISKGDLMNPSIWPGSQAPMKILRVVEVEHIIWENENEIKHKLMVYTEEVDVAKEPRLSTRP
jgi:hypothetical protein